MPLKTPELSQRPLNRRRSGGKVWMGHPVGRWPISPKTAFNHLRATSPPVAPVAPRTRIKALLPWSCFFPNVTLKCLRALFSFLALKEKCLFHSSVAHSEHLAVEVDCGIAIVSPNLHLI